MEENKEHRDMSPEEFRKFGYQLVDWASDYLKNIESYKVLPDVKPGDIKAQISPEPEYKGRGLRQNY